MKTKLTAVLLIIALLFSLAGCKSKEQNTVTEKEEINPSTLMWTENYKISVSMMTYYFNSVYQNFIKDNNAKLTELGLDVKTSLKTQKYDSTYTWYEYFLSQTITSAKRFLFLAEAAKEAGLELTDDDRAEIDKELSNLSTGASSRNTSTDALIKSVYGELVNTTTVKKCLELSTFSKKYYTVLSRGYSFTDDDFNKYFEENKNQLLTFSYICYQEKPDNAEALCDSFAACTTEEEYTDLIRKQMSAAVYDAENNNIENRLKDCYVYNAGYKENSSFAKWAYEDARKPYDVYNSITTDGTVLTAMILPSNKEAYSPVLSRDNIPVHNIKSILFDITVYGNDDKARAKAEEVYQSWQEKPDSDTFDKLIEEYNGGNTINIKYGSLADELQNWIFDEARYTGEVSLVTIPVTGTYLIMMEDDGIEGWKQDAKDALIAQRYDADIAALDDKYELLYNNDGLSEITEINHD